ncbi:hypothetical protein QWY86_06210 [Pedobacter aquatilis]|uniref:hypothetical protein n=1 Tax=Pedobacter aquatilis TaxID=351343 RepID=UPI0025B2E9CC|nr:hypothetical protein [Pedobacter aquatilis]MDN3586252.1 hypothetical protein [Pedobacter aquatilis]
MKGKKSILILLWKANMLGRNYKIAVYTLLLVFLFGACKKPGGEAGIPSAKSQKIYSDSVLYIQASDVTAKPVITLNGSYTSLPEGLKIDKKTGYIDVNQSETGLKYLVLFTPAGSSETIKSYVTISGINYPDKIFNLAQGDSIAEPIYNANPKLLFPNPGKNNLFDENGGCKKAGIVINAENARINLAQSIRNQAIDTGATEQVKLAYRINDGSNRTVNGLNVKIYFYRNAKEIPKYLTELLAVRKTTVLAAGTDNQTITTSTQNLLDLASKSVSLARPRPPCIIVVGN